MVLIADFRKKDARVLRKSFRPLAGIMVLIYGNDDKHKAV